MSTISTMAACGRRLARGKGQGGQHGGTPGPPNLSSTVVLGWLL